LTCGNFGLDMKASSRRLFLRCEISGGMGARIAPIRSDAPAAIAGIRHTDRRITASPRGGAAVDLKEKCLSPFAPAHEGAPLDFRRILGEAHDVLGD